MKQYSNETMNHYLVIRLSSMGDVALTVPVLQVVGKQNEKVHCTLVTRGIFKDMFTDNPNVSIVEADVKGKHKGILGLVKLFWELRKMHQFKAVIDLHDVLRSTILRNLFRVLGIPVFKIDKGRKEKKAATANPHPPITKLKHVTERYADVFRKADLTVDLNAFEPLHLPKTEAINNFLASIHHPIVGIAPFAQHAQKMLPLAKTIELTQDLVAKGYQVVIFGGGKSEQTQAIKILSKCRHQVISIIGQFSLLEEMALMQSVKFMITMDSSNMHLARLVGTKVVSIWGATHPYLGFSAFLQTDENLNIQIPVADLPCRPCSVYGNKICHRGDWACLNQKISYEKLDISYNS